MGLWKVQSFVLNKIKFDFVHKTICHAPFKKIDKHFKRIKFYQISLNVQSPNVRIPQKRGEKGEIIHLNKLGVEDTL